jgi:hypothetical protein
VSAADFDLVEEGGKRWRYVERLEDEARERALGLLVQRESAFRTRGGLPPVTRPNPALMRCGHLRSCTRRDDSGVEICAACEWADLEASRG